MYLSLMSVRKFRKNPRKNWSTLNGCNSKNSQRMTTPLSKITALFVLNRWYQNEAVRARDACARPEKVWRRCVAGACRLKSPMENNACFPLSSKVARGWPRVKLQIWQFTIQLCLLKNSVSSISWLWSQLMVCIWCHQKYDHANYDQFAPSFDMS